MHVCGGCGRGVLRSAVTVRRTSSVRASAFKKPQNSLDVPVAHTLVTRSVDELQDLLDEAVVREDYEAAAEYRDEITSLEAADPWKATNAALLEAIQEERFEDAADLRDELRTMVKPHDLTNPGSTFSELVTDGIRVRAASFYIDWHSNPESGEYLFAYKVTITNEGDDVVQLRSRHWMITDAQKRVEEVKGPGVVGEQPILRPGESFDYQSACPLRTAVGHMDGSFQMIRLNKDSGIWGDGFDAKVGLFYLDEAVKEVRTLSQEADVGCP